jgi:hypothetical protein
MSASTQIRTAGWRSLSAVNGETMSVGGVPIVCVVNRVPLKAKDAPMSKDGKLDFTILGSTVIEFLIADFAGQPVAGNTFIDSLGFSHRVSYIIHSDITWVCYCVPSQIPTA